MISQWERDTIAERVRLERRTREIWAVHSVLPTPEKWNGRLTMWRWLLRGFCPLLHDAAKQVIR